MLRLITFGLMFSATFIGVQPAMSAPSVSLRGGEQPTTPTPTT